MKHDKWNREAYGTICAILQDYADLTDPYGFMDTDNTLSVEPDTLQGIISYLSLDVSEGYPAAEEVKAAVIAYNAYLIVSGNRDDTGTPIYWPALSDSFGKARAAIFRASI